MNKKIIGAVVGVVLIAGGSFYGGMTYAKSGQGSNAGRFAQGAQFMMGVGGMRGAAGGGFTAGEILSKDDSSLTLKMQDGSTKIIVLAPSTQVTKNVSGSLSDLITGINVTVTGSANSDGSVTAQSIQIRPAGFMASTTRNQI